MNDQILLVAHGQIASWLDGTATSDGNTYHNVLSFRLPIRAGGVSAGHQWRHKFGNKTVSIPDGDQVPMGKQVILTDVSIHAAFGYDLNDNMVIQMVRDAIEIPAQFQIVLAGSVMDYYEDCWPASRFGVFGSPGWLQNAEPQSVRMGMIPARSTQVTHFSRLLEFRLPRDILIDEEEDFQIQMKLATPTPANLAFEYDVWAGGYIQDKP